MAATEMALSDVGNSPDLTGTVDPDSEGVFETVDTGKEDTTSTVTLTGSEDKGTDKDVQATDQTADATVKPLAGDDDSFDKHPRWQEWKKQRDDATQRADIAEAENRILKELSVKRPEAPVVPEAKPYRDITQMTDGEVEALMRDNPKVFAANLYMQVKDEAIRDAMATIRGEQQKERSEATLKETYAKFEKNNADFRPMWDKGEIQKFMDANPGHNPMSAYREMTLTPRIEAAAKEAVEKARKTFEADLKAKRSATTLGKTTQGTPQGDIDAELKDTKAHGGTVAAIAARLARMRNT